jgi:hypothetical protein
MLDFAGDAVWQINSMQHHAEHTAYLGLMVAAAAIVVWSMLLLLVTFAIY